MRDWAEHFGLVELRKTSGVGARENPNGYVYLTAEVAMPLENYAALPPWEQATARAAAVGLTLDTAVVAGTAAARLWGIDVLDWRQPRVDALHVDGKRAGGRCRSTPAVRYRFGRLPESGVWADHGIRATRVLRTLRDICCYDGLVAGVVAIDSARRKWPELTAPVLRHGMISGSRFEGAPLVREAIRLSIPNAGSALESHARILLVLADVPGIESIVAQAEIRDPATGTTYYVDLLVNGWLIVEIDGEVKYDGESFGGTDDVIRDERRREKALQNTGRVVVRVSDPRDAPAVVAHALATFRGVEA